MAPKLPTSEIDQVVRRAFDAESSVVVSVRGAGCADSVLFNQGDVLGELSPSAALKMLWKRVEIESKACAKRGLQATVRVSFLQILGGSFHDLLSSSSVPAQLSLRDYDPSKSPHVSGADEVTVTSEAEMLECFWHGTERLKPYKEYAARPSTDMNEQTGSPAHSPRSDDSSACMPGRGLAGGSPESHLVFCFHIHLQGPLTAMPSQQNLVKTKPAKPSGSCRKVPPKEVDEWIFRSVLRCMDICVPLSRSSTSAPEQSSLATVHTAHHTDSACSEATPLAALDASEAHIPAAQASQPDHASHEHQVVVMDSSSMEQPASSPPDGLSPCSAVSPPVPQHTRSMGGSPSMNPPETGSCLHSEGDGQAAGDNDDHNGGMGEAVKGTAGHEEDSADAEASGSDGNRKRTLNAFVFTAPARLQGDSAQGSTQRQRPDSAQGSTQRQRPHHEVSALVGLQTSARRLRKSLSTRSPVIMSLVTGAAARAPSRQLPGADTATGERAVVEQVSGVQALEAVVCARQEQKAMLPFRAHLLTRILQPAINGTAHCVTLPEPPHLHTQTAEAGKGFGGRHRAAALRVFFSALQAHSPRRDIARLDMQSDVVKWMQLENRSLKGELKTARDKVVMLQKFVASRGAQEVKTWELWRELEMMRASATELRSEADTLQAALHGARSTAAAAEAAAEAAGERAAAEASMRAGARREAAGAAARAAAMEAAVDRMARHLADASAGGSHPIGTGAMQPRAELNWGNTGSVGAAFDADTSVCNGDAAPPAVSVALTVVDGTVQVRMRSRGSLTAEARPTAAALVIDRNLSSQAAPGPPTRAVQARPDDVETVAAEAGELRLPAAALAVRETLSAALASAAQRHVLRREQARRAAAASGHDSVADSTVAGLLTLLARALTPLAAAPSLTSASLYPLSTGGGVTAVASACSLDAALETQPLASPRTPSYAAPQSLASASEQSPWAPDSAHTEPTAYPAAPSSNADQSPSQWSTLDPLSDAGPLHTAPMPDSAGHLATDTSRATVLQPPGGSDISASGSQIPEHLGTTRLSGRLYRPVEGESPDARRAGGGLSNEGEVQGQFQGLRTAWPGDVAVLPAEWVSALLSVLRLPRVIQERITSLESQGDEAAMEVQHLQLQQQHATTVQSVLLTPVDAPSVHTLYALWGWLQPAAPPQPCPQQPPPAPTCPTTRHPADSATPYSIAPSSLQLEQPEGGSDSECAACHVASAHAPDAAEGAACPAGRWRLQQLEHWRALAATLHEVVCGLGRQGERTARTERDKLDSEVRLMQDSIQAHQASDQDHHRLHSEAAEHIAHMQAQCEDATACARVFDETVENLVAAKMAHATADAALRAMRDQVEALSAQVPLSAGQSTQRDGEGSSGAGRDRLLSSMLAWGRRSRGSGELLQVTEPQDVSRHEARLPAAVSRSAAMAKSAFSGLSSYFSPKPPTRTEPPDPQASPHARW